jgi:hypothetical protein
MVLVRTISSVIDNNQVVEQFPCRQKNLVRQDPRDVAGSLHPISRADGFVI